MSSVLFWKCNCGTEWRATVGTDHKTTLYSCRCGNVQKLTGTAIEVHYIPPNSGSEVDWAVAPATKP
jgi:hypothetical protein